jgi:hypothetical protein
MKKVSMVLLIVFLASTTVYPFRMGLDFGVSDKATVGLNLRIVDKFELKPALGFGFSENVNNFTLSVDGNFYLPQIQALQHYAGPQIWFNFISNDAHDDVFAGLNGHYGLRYDINDIISTFGEIGINLQFDPFFLATFRGGLGLTFYFPGIR